MKLKTKLFLSLIVVMISLLVFPLSNLGMARQQRKADAVLTEAKQELAEDLGVYPEDLTVYWSGEYMPDSQYRYRCYPSSSSSSTEEGADYSAHARSVDPRYGDSVIKDDEVKKLVRKAVDHQNRVESWENIALMAVLVIFGAIIMIPVNIVLSVYDWIKSQNAE